MGIQKYQNTLPVKVDFSPIAIAKALFQHSIEHWSLRYSIALFFGSLVFGVLFGFTYLLFLVELGTLSFGAIAWIYNYYLNAGNFKKKHITRLNSIIKEQTEKKLKDLKENLNIFSEDHGAKQLEQFQQKFDVLTDIIASKFDPSQLTYGRYYGISQEVFLSAIDNLTDVLMAHKTLSGIDLNYINDRLNSLAMKSNTSSAKMEFDALNRSLASHKELNDKIQELLAQNEAALTQMDETAIAVSEIQRGANRQSDIDLENAMKALAELKERSVLYSR